MGLKRTSATKGTAEKTKRARVISVRAETRSEGEEPSNSNEPAPIRPRARIYKCSWCGRNSRSRKLIRKVVNAGPVPWKSPIGDDVIAGAFLCQPTCYLAWMNRSGQLRKSKLTSNDSEDTSNGGFKDKEADNLQYTADIEDPDLAKMTRSARKAAVLASASSAASASK